MNTLRRIFFLEKAVAGLFAAAIMLCLPAGSVLAQQSLAEQATNPAANLIQFQIQDVYNWENHNSSGYGNTTIIQPVIPVPLGSEKWPLMIARITLPYVTTPNLGPGVGRRRGFGDLVVLGLFTPKLKTKGMQLGFGYTLGFPTAGDNDFTGSGKYLAGPAFLYINMKTPGLQWGLFAFQEWSYASSHGNGSRSSVSKLSLQPFITKHFGKGWFIGSPDSPQVYNFKNDKWTYTLGPQLGKVTKIGNLNAKIFGAIYYNPEDDVNAGPTAKWTFKFNVTFLFPEG